MSSEEIQAFVKGHKIPANKHLKISFKKREPVFGIIVECKDAGDLQSKNFWRIVTLPNLKSWHSSNDLNLSRIYHGSDFSRITVE